MRSSVKPMGERKMPDSKAKVKWIKENTTVIAVKLNHNTDADILSYIEDESSKAGIFKKAMKEFIHNNPKSKTEDKKMKTYENTNVSDEAQAIVDNGLYNAAVELMDDEIREELHNLLAPCSDAEFLSAYMEAHRAKYGEDFTI